MLRFVALSLVLAGLSNAAVFNQTHQDAKGVWNFQWNFGNGGLPPPDQTNHSQHLPFCTPVQGCANPASCIMGPMMTMQCDPTQEPHTLCYSPSTPQMDCTPLPGMPICACESDWSQQMPDCPTVEGCLQPGNCFASDGMNYGLCESAMEPGIQCYSSSMPAAEYCTRHPHISTCACDRHAAPMPPCPTVSGCANYMNCHGTPQMCNGAVEPNTQCYSMSTPPMNCNYDPTVQWCACENNYYP